MIFLICTPGGAIPDDQTVVSENARMRERRDVICQTNGYEMRISVEISSICFISFKEEASVAFNMWRHVVSETLWYSLEPCIGRAVPAGRA